MKLGTYLGSDNTKVIILTSFNIFPFVLLLVFCKSSSCLAFWFFLFLFTCLHPHDYTFVNIAAQQNLSHMERRHFPVTVVWHRFLEKNFPFLLSLEVEINNWYVLKINSVSKLSWDPMTTSTGGVVPVILYYVLSSYINIQLFLVNELMSCSLKYDN